MAQKTAPPLSSALYKKKGMTNQPKFISFTGKEIGDAPQNINQQEERGS